MHPVLFHVPILGFPIRSFGVLVAGGFLLAVWLWGKFLARYGDDPADDPVRGSQVGMWVLIGVLGGARLMYVAVETSRYLAAERTPAIDAYLGADDRSAAAGRLLAEDPAALERATQLAVGYDFLHDPVQVLFVWKGGMVMYGGFFGAVLLGLWAARRAGLEPLHSLDTGLVCGFYGQAVGRWGCLLVGDDYGSVVPERYRDLPFPITITVPSLDWLEAHPESLFDHQLAGEVLWATQVWMSVNAAVLASAAWYLLLHRRWRGQVAAFVILYYSVSRFAIESFRGDSVRGLWFGDRISTSQLIAIPGALIGAWFLWRNRARADGPLPHRPA